MSDYEFISVPVIGVLVLTKSRSALFNGLFNALSSYSLTKEFKIAFVGCSICVMLFNRFSTNSIDVADSSILSFIANELPELKSNADILIIFYEN